jgi:hypothetical protein
MSFLPDKPVDKAGLDENYDSGINGPQGTL